MASSTPPRRFNPAPYETSGKSSKESKELSQLAEDKPKAPRRFVPEPIESTTSRRKFVVAPVEETQKKQRKFAPEPIETTKTERRGNAPETKPIGPRKFNIDPTETTIRSKRKDDAPTPQIVEPPPEATQKASPKPRRRFVPQLLETAKRSRRVGDCAPALLPSDKTEALPIKDAPKPRKCPPLSVPTPPEIAPLSEFSQNPLFLEVKRAASPFFQRTASRRSTRSQHSFRVPELDPIESSQSEDSNPPSLSTSPSSTSGQSYLQSYKDATRIRESLDDRCSGYLLQLAAKTAEKQLREQAMAAFPNSDFHEPVDHFIDHDSEETEATVDEVRDGDFYRRESAFSQANLELLAMRRHREKLEQEKEIERERKLRREAELNRHHALGYSPWANAAMGLFDSVAPKDIIGWQKDMEIDKMRNGARPPMLGKDIVFPRCQSPDPARFDTTQSSETTKSAMCYLTQQCQEHDKGRGLWCGRESGRQISSQGTTLWSNVPSRAPSKVGLWGGHCLDQGKGSMSSPRKPTGLLTPQLEIQNPLETPHPTPFNTGVLPPTPPESSTDVMMSGIDEKLAAEQRIEEEFGNTFVTQVYNYLSLGYPAVARDFDDELSKISNIPVSELRQDDYLAKSRGYIQLGPDGNLRDTDITEETCVRWRALRLYIQEWARQQPQMAIPEKGHLAGIGTIARKGSWAL